MILALPESLDLVLDGVTSSTADSLLTEQAKSAFELSWLDVGRRGDFIAKLGLAGVLKAIMCFSFAYQFIYFNIHAARARCQVSHLSDGKRGLFWSATCACLEDGSLCFLAGVADQMASALGDDDPSAAKLRGKVCLETLPTLWFSGSLLGLAMHFDEDKRVLTHCLTLASICTSLLSSWKALGEHLWGWCSQKPKISLNARARKCRMVLYPVVLVGAPLFVLTVRVVRIWNCPQHNFSVRKWACDTWSEMA